jgi:hypothetical protein
LKKMLYLLGKLCVYHARAEHRLEKHVEQAEPVVELHFETAESSFVVRDLHPQAAKAWREFCQGLMAEQENCGASLRIIDPAGNGGQLIDLPVRKAGNAA